MIEEISTMTMIIRMMMMMSNLEASFVWIWNLVFATVGKTVAGKTEDIITMIIIVITMIIIVIVIIIIMIITIPIIIMIIIT